MIIHNHDSNGIMNYIFINYYLDGFIIAKFSSNNLKHNKFHDNMTIIGWCYVSRCLTIVFNFITSFDKLKLFIHTIYYLDMFVILIKMLTEWL